MYVLFLLLPHPFPQAFCKQLFDFSFGPGLFFSFLLSFGLSVIGEFFENVFSESIPKSVIENLNKAQEIRNELIHGKETTDPKRREALYYAIEYMKAVGAFVKDKSGKNPYGDLRGLAGKKKLLPAKSTIWMLKGFGLGDKTTPSIA